MVQDTQINETETNRRKVSRPKLSLNYQSLVNQKIDDLFQQSRSSQQDWMRNRIESSMEEESVKKQLVFIQKINALEKDKNDLKLLVK